MPDDPREPFRPVVRIAARRATDAGFSEGNTSGLRPAEIAALNAALVRLMAAGLAEREAKLALDAAVRDWLLPLDAAEADLERLLAWR